jgi:hypothetical protein
MMDLKTPRVLNPFRFLGSPNGAGRRIVGRRRRRYAIYAGARFAVSDAPVFHPVAPVRIIAGTPNPQMKRWQRIVSNFLQPRFDTPTSVSRGRRQLVNREFLSSTNQGRLFAMARFCTVADAASRNFFVEEQYKEG